MASDLEAAFATALAQHAPDLPRAEQQFAFAKEIGRRWRADFAWADARLLLEIEGIFGGKSRHRTTTGYHNDCDKYNAATLLGWRLLRFTSKHVRADAAGCVEMVRRALAVDHATFHA